MSTSDWADRGRKITVTACRIILGATFVLSGFAKSIDPAGTVYKIEDYLSAWGLEGFHVLDVTAAFGLSAGEFALGALMLLGCYRRMLPWLFAAVMAFMLPLSAYIWIADPVPDCGCFGDMLVISNAATFAKNVVIVALTVPLLLWNRRTGTLVPPPMQWIALALSLAYPLCIGIIGYKYQPLLDFRPYPVGTRMAVAPEEDAGEDDWDFVYEKDGERHTFSIDSLPDESWTFVERIEPEKPAVKGTGIAFFDDEGNDVTASTIDADADQLLVLIPDTRSVGYSRAHLIRSFGSAMERTGGRMTVVIAGDTDYSWRDHVGRGLEVVLSEDTSIKELARGDIALVYLKAGVVQWKIDATSLPTDYLDNAPLSRSYPLGRIDINSGKWLWSLTVLYICALSLLISLPWLMSQISVARKHKKD